MKENLDIRGLMCPMTWARVRMKLGGMEAGRRLRVLLDHRPAVADIRRNSEELGHLVLECRQEQGDEWVIEIEVGSEEA